MIIQKHRVSRFVFFICTLSMTMLSLTEAKIQDVQYDPKHRLWGEVLADFVSEGEVDYASLQKSPVKLDLYLDQLAAVSKQEFDRWPETEQLAYLYNLYNAQTLKLIITHYPIRSIRDIGGLFAGAWDRRIVRLFGKYTSLNVLKHEIIRQGFNEPRAHFALVLAAKSSPNLKSEPYLPNKLNDQLNEQVRHFLADQNNNYVHDEDQKIYLSSIFKWFRKDFERTHGQLQSFIRSFAPEDLKRALDAGYALKFIDYDWRLNQKETPA